MNPLTYVADTALVQIYDVDLLARPWPFCIGRDRFKSFYRIDMRVQSGWDHVPAVDEWYWIERRFGWWTLAAYFVPATDNSWQQLAVSVPIHNTSVPPGSILIWGGNPSTTPPAGYLMCDHAAISRADYAALFDATGTRHGAGNGTTTFNLPDMNTGPTKYMIRY